MFIVDRRLNPGSKSLENGQRFLSRAKALVQGAIEPDLRLALAKPYFRRLRST